MSGKPSPNIKIEKMRSGLCNLHDEYSGICRKLCASTKIIKMLTALKNWCNIMKIEQTQWTLCIVVFINKKYPERYIIET